jgi:hypothetical protein
MGDGIVEKKWSPVGEVIQFFHFGDKRVRPALVSEGKRNM